VSKEYADTLKEGLEMVKEGVGILAGGPLSFYIEEVSEMIDMLFERFCPFKIGDRVMLTKPIDFAKSYGYRQHAHWMVPGAKGTVKAVGAQDKQFWAAVEFDDESWVWDGEIRPTKDKHHFRFSESQLSRIVE
jgi:hypothetical protein